MDQHTLPRRQPGVIEQALPRRHGGERDRRRGRHVDTVGDRAQLDGLDDHIVRLRTAIEIDEGEHRIAVAQHVVRARADGLDRSSKVAAQRRGQRILPDG